MSINKPSVFIGENNQDQLYFTQAKTGINTTDPTEKLEVAGNVKANFFIGDGSLLTNVGGGTDLLPLNNTWTGLNTFTAGLESTGAGANSFRAGTSAGLTGQGNNAVAVGNLAGNTVQAAGATAVGQQAAQLNQSSNAVAVGRQSGYSAQGANSTAVGYLAGNNTQGGSSVAVGISAGQTTQGASSVAIGVSTGQTNQSDNAVAVGNNAGLTGQGAQASAFGYFAGRYNQGANAVAIGREAGEGSAAVGDFQGVNSVAVGYSAGTTTQGGSSVAIGDSAGQTTQGSNSVAVGVSAASGNQGGYGVAIGAQAGQTNQSNFGVAIGNLSGQTTQGSNAVALGNSAGQTTQGTNAVAVGKSAGQTTQGNETVAIGYLAGQTSQGAGATALGRNAGNNTQGAHSVAIGNNAALLNQGANGIIINSTSAALDDTTAGHIHIASDDGSIDFTTLGGWTATDQVGTFDLRSSSANLLTLDNTWTGENRFTQATSGFGVKLGEETASLFPALSDGIISMQSHDMFIGPSNASASVVFPYATTHEGGITSNQYINQAITGNGNGATPPVAAIRNNTTQTITGAGDPTLGQNLPAFVEDTGTYNLDRSNLNGSGALFKAASTVNFSGTPAFLSVAGPWSALDAKVSFDNTSSGDMIFTNQGVNVETTINNTSGAVFTANEYAFRAAPTLGPNVSGGTLASMLCVAPIIDASSTLLNNFGIFIQPRTQGSNSNVGVFYGNDVNFPVNGEEYSFFSASGIHSTGGGVVNKVTTFSSGTNTLNTTHNYIILKINALIVLPNVSAVPTGMTYRILNITGSNRTITSISTIVGNPVIMGTNTSRTCVSDGTVWNLLY